LVNIAFFKFVSCQYEPKETVKTEETVDQNREESSDSSIPSEKEDEDSYRRQNFSILRQQLFATDSESDRASGRRKVVIARFMKNPKLAHKTCLLCGFSFTEKKSLYRHYRQQKPCQERVT